MDYKITHILEEPRIGDDGRPTRDHRVEFRVEPDGPFYERFTEAEFTPENVRARLTARAANLTQIRSTY